MHRHVRRVGDQRAVAAKTAAGEIERSLMFDRNRRYSAADTPFAGDRHEEIVEHSSIDRVGIGADRVPALELTVRASTNDFCR